VRESAPGQSGNLGIASAAVAAAKRIASDRLGLHRLQAEALIRQRRVPSGSPQAGFVQYGQAPEYLKIAGR
jgi:[ribosomal protein S5]-alanine N-acetyltransferase